MVKRERRKKERKKNRVFVDDHSSLATRADLAPSVRRAFVPPSGETPGAWCVRVEDLFPLGQRGAAKETGENRRHNARRRGIRMFALMGARTALPSPATLSLNVPRECIQPLKPLTFVVSRNSLVNLESIFPQQKSDRANLVSHRVS